MIFKLSENTSDAVQVGRVGNFQHEIYGNFSITLSDLEQWKANFEANVRRQEFNGYPVLPLDYRHAEEDIAAGWIKKLDIRDDKKGNKALFAKVDWTPKGAQKVKDREFAFISPSYRPIYKDSETGRKFKQVLKGATLTNVPFVRDMEAVHLLSEDRRNAFKSLKLSGDNPDSNKKTGGNMPTFKEILEGLDSVSPEDKVKLTEAVREESKDVKLSEELAKAKTDLTKAQGDLKLSEDEKKKLETKMEGSGEFEDRVKLAEAKLTESDKKVASLVSEMAKDKKKGKFDLMLSEGKACEAQREAYMKGDVDEFSEKAEPVKLSESGHGEKGEDGIDQANKKLAKIVKDKMELDETLEYGEASSIALSENPDINRMLGY